MLGGAKLPPHMSTLAARAAVVKTKSTVAAAIIVGRLMKRQGIIVSSMNCEIAATPKL